MKGYVQLSPMRLSGELGEQLEIIASVLTAMRMEKVTIPGAARHAMVLGIRAFFAQPEVKTLIREAKEKAAKGEEG